MQLRNKVVAYRSLVAGVDGCPDGWVAFKVNLDSRATAVEVVDLPAILRDPSCSFAALAIDIPIGCSMSLALVTARLGSYLVRCVDAVFSQRRAEQC